MKKAWFDNDQELWLRFIAGEKDAFAFLFENYSDAMFAYGKKICSDSELVKDTIQDLFIKMFNNRETLHCKGSIKGYLLIALKRSLFNRLNKKSHFSIDDPDAGNFEIELIEKSEQEEEHFLYNEETKIKLSLALKSLTARQREAIYLYYIQEIPLAEISEILEMNYQSTRNLIHRALLNLRQQFKPAISLANMSLLLLQYLSK